MQQYLQEDGTGGFAGCFVNDVIPPNNGQLNLLLLFESPHRDELRTGIPLSGGAGRAAFRALMPLSAPPQALGQFIAARHALGDCRVGIMNVSRVPLQLAAYKDRRSKQAVTHLDWNLLERIRIDREDRIEHMPDSKLQTASRLLLPSLELRLSRIQFSAQATVFPAGRFAQRHWNSLATRPHVSALPVPHPSNGWWTRSTAKRDVDNLAELWRLFERNTS